MNSEDKFFAILVVAITAIAIVGLLVIQTGKYLETREAVRAGLVQKVVGGETVWTKP